MIKSADGTEIAYDKSGDGPALILVAGALTTRVAFGPLAALLAPHFTVYAYDRRGRGDSGDTSPYAPDREIDDIAAVIEAAGGSAYAFGHSSGAALVLDAAQRGEGITKIAAYEPPFIVDDSRTPSPSDFVSRLTGLVRDDRDEAFAYWMAETVQQSPEEIAAWRGSPPWKELVGIVHTTVYDATIMDGRMTGKPLPADAFADVAVPTLVIDGEVSPPFMHHTADAVAALIPGAQRHTFAGAGHGAPPEQVAPILINFFGGTS